MGRIERKLESGFYKGIERSRFREKKKFGTWLAFKCTDEPSGTADLRAALVSFQEFAERIPWPDFGEIR
ncbi:hypothetical protein, partial [Streptomyces shaanxiensis]|uniref:hypothetical protein n=1 Tax=Streptomyces shaanxiensis TaxID=653357 RepID=UPI0031E584F9